MKKILLFAAILFSLNTQAQNIHYDSTSGSSYVRITPVKVRYDKPMATRLYASISSPLNGYVTVSWQLKDSVYIDAETNNFHILDEGALSVKVSDNNISITEMMQLLFSSVCDNLGLTIK